MTCNGVNQSLDNRYTLSFENKSGAYVSKAAKCTQIEPEQYKYLSESKISIKQGVRTCMPNPCAADLPASECGKETNAQEPAFDVALSDKNKMLVLTTDDPKAIDCTGVGQKKPAVFVFSRITP